MQADVSQPNNGEQSEVSTFPDELLERLSDEQYLINASPIRFGDQRPSRVQS